MFANNLLRRISLFEVGVISILGSGPSDTIDNDVRFIVVPIIIIGKIKARG